MIVESLEILEIWIIELENSSEIKISGIKIIRKLFSNRFFFYYEQWTKFLFPNQWIKIIKYFYKMSAIL
jgi:hypothetical protein